MRVIVTGSSGRLGSTVVAALRDRYEVIGIDLAPAATTTIVGSIEDAALIERVFWAHDPIAGVIHTASLHAPHVGRAPRERFEEVNVAATRCLLEQAVAHGARRFVYTSTTSVYGDALVPTDRAVWVTEELPPRPRDIYDETKLAAEGLCAAFAAAGRLSTVCLRAGRFFAEAPALVAAYRLYRGLDVRDAAAAHVLALEHPDRPEGVFNLAARSPFTPDDLVELLTDAPAVIRRRVPGAEAAFAARGWPLPAGIDRVYVIARAEAGLGYRPVHDLATCFASGTAEASGR